MTEFLISIFIITSIQLTSFSIYIKINEELRANIWQQVTQNCFYKAQLLAMQTESKVEIQPINGEFRFGYKILSNENIYFIKNPKPNNLSIKLMAFASNTKITIDPCGFTQNNGHLRYISSTFGKNIVIRNVYFNKALRIYFN